MKQILIFLMIVSSLKTYSQDWMQILQTEAEEYFYKPNTFNTAWIKIVSEKIEYLSEETLKEEIIDGYKMTLWKFDCSGKKIGIIQAIVYSKEGKALSSFKQNEILVDMEFVIPETVGERMLNVFCEN